MEQGRQQHTGRLAGVSSGVPAWERDENENETHQKRGEKRGESGDGRRRRTPAGVLGPGNDNDRASQGHAGASYSNDERLVPARAFYVTQQDRRSRERKKERPGAMAGMVSIADLPSIAWPGTGTGVSSLP